LLHKKFVYEDSQKETKKHLDNAYLLDKKRIITSLQIQKIFVYNPKLIQNIQQSI